MTHIEIFIYKFIFFSIYAFYFNNYKIERVLIERKKKEFFISNFKIERK